MSCDPVETVNIFGVSVARMTLSEAAETFSEEARKQETLVVFTINAQHIVLMSQEEEFRGAYHLADWIVPDGMPVVWFSRLIGKILPERVTGSDLLPELCRMAVKKALKVFFLGGTPEVMLNAMSNLQKQFPTLKVVGMASPQIDLKEKEDREEDLIYTINSSSPDIVFVGFGAPKQEIWTIRNRSRLKTGIVCMVGGSFDFLGGKTIRAPVWMQKAGLEWLWRLFHEPKRLWRRYLIGNFLFLRIAWKELWNLRKVQ